MKYNSVARGLGEVLRGCLLYVGLWRQFFFFFFTMMRPDANMPIVVWSGMCVRDRCFSWCAKACCPVDSCTTANHSSLEYFDAAIFGLSSGWLLIKIGIGFIFFHVKITGSLKRPFFHDDDVQSRLSQNFCRISSFRSGTDNHDICLKALIFTQPRRVNMFPSLLETLCHKIKDRIFWITHLWLFDKNSKIHPAT